MKRWAIEGNGRILFHWEYSDILFIRKHAELIWPPFFYHCQMWGDILKSFFFLPVVQNSVNSFVRLHSDSEILGARLCFPDSDITQNSGLLQQTFTTLIFIFF